MNRVPQDDMWQDIITIVSGLEQRIRSRCKCCMRTRWVNKLNMICIGLLMRMPGSGSNGSERTGYIKLYFIGICLL